MRLLTFFFLLTCCHFKIGALVDTVGGPIFRDGEDTQDSDICIMWYGVTDKQCFIVR